MIIVFDTFSGLCNQFMDINTGINFCIINNIKFTFRYCNLRNKNLISWYNEKFNKLFDTKFIEEYKDLYIDFDTIKLTEENTFNFKGNTCVNLFTNNFINEINEIDKEHIVLKQIWPIFYNNFKIINHLTEKIKPSNRIMDLYNNIKNKLLLNNEEYNFIHYRYEIDFTNHFKINIESLKNIVFDCKKKFKNPELKIYIATSNFKRIVDLNDTELCNIIFTKNEDELLEYNFEELAFVDYMFGLNSNEVFGHSKSSFSHTLNSLKGTQNYYA